MEVTLFKDGSVSKRVRGIRFRRMKHREGEIGFTVVEVIIAAAIFTIVSASLLGLFAYSLSTMQMSQQEMIARQKAREVLENVFAARNSGQIVWSDIEGATKGGSFLEGPQPMLLPGLDGILGTKDDGPQMDALVYPGPDGILGTPDDIRMNLSNFTRQIEISDVMRIDANGNPLVISDIRQMKVTITYFVPQFGTRSYVVSAFVSLYR